MEQVTTGFRLKQLLHHGLIFGLTSSLQSALGFILLPLYTKYLTLEEFGIYNMLLVISAACNTIFGLGASSALGRYYFEYKESGKERECLSSALWISFSGSLLLIMVALISAYPVCEYYFDDLSLIRPYILCLTGNSLSYPLATLTLLLRYKKRSVLYLIVTILGLLLNFGVTISLLIFSNMKISAPFVGLIVSNFLIITVLIFNQRNNMTFRVSKGDYQVIFYFGLQVILTAFLSYIYECSDKIVMKEMLGIEDVGIYSLSGKIGSVFKIFVYLPFALIWAPLRMEYRNNADNSIFIGRIAKYYSLIGMTVLWGCMIWGYDILCYLFPQEDYALALKIYPLSMLGYFFFGYSSIFDFGIFITNKLYYQSIINIICLAINTILNIWLLPLYGVFIAPFIFAITYIISAFLLYGISNKYYKIPLNWMQLIGMYIIWTTLYTIFFVFDQSVVNNWPIKLIISLIIIYLSWNIFLSKTERDVVVRKFNSYF